ncbi:uncharacterized protein DUF1311 [Marinobacter sp. LV10R520-4]|uniref:lysozyme inhibitor LprI family protein n=1 Tax=Marinobacter sp. LV10R520-4 TaxID=1761796 RepID=UPI000BF5D866|nr:lysozyme inhibitor LprI family protein [Marinobacter sp. LV10R520-4]PFG51968.1 uncharacterized protein DUF1311 [Marinobacter sp. LV10R520-4]
MVQSSAMAIIFASTLGLPLFFFDAVSVAAEQPRKITPAAFVNEFNMRTIFSSYGQALKYYCGKYPNEFFSTIHYVSDTELRLYDDTNYWQVNFEDDNRILLLNKIMGASYNSESMYHLGYFNSIHQWRASEALIEQEENCEPIKLDRQISFGSGNYSSKEITTYVDSHDQGYVELGNGEKVKVDSSVLYWKEIDAWAKGKAVSLIYEPSTGTRLVGLDTGKAIPVIFYSGESPLNQIESACVELADDDLARFECYGQSLRGWDAELNRNYTTLLSVLDDQEKLKIRAAQRKWLEYRDSQLEAIGLLSNRPGAISEIRPARMAAWITREQAVRLGNVISSL